MDALAKSFGALVGFSDHSKGIVASVGARMLGACFIEKHFTLDNSLEGPDHFFSSSPEEFKYLVDSINEIDQALGDSSIGFKKSENYSHENYRLSCVATQDLEKGMILDNSHIKYARPGTGLPPKDKKYILGRKLKNKLKKGQLILIDDF